MGREGYGREVGRDWAMSSVRLWMGGCVGVRRRDGLKVAKGCQSPVGVGVGTGVSGWAG